MLTLPDAHPGTPDVRSTTRYLLWLARRQWRTQLVGMALGGVWMLGHAAVPAVLGRTIDAGVVRRDGQALLTGTAVLVGIGLWQAVTGVFRHRLAVANWLQAALRTQHVVGHHVADAGPAVTATTTTGEAISTVANDAPRIADVFDVLGRFTGAVLSFVAVALVVLRIDAGLGLFVLAGAPLLSASLLVVVRPLNARQAAHREAEGALTALGADTVAGLRVLRGIGGEEQFLGRYRESSERVRRAGVRVAAPQAGLDAAHVLLPGAFVVALTWLGARAAVGGTITAGELVALYGYAAFLGLPIATTTETIGKVVRGRVAARRIVTLLRKRPDDDAATAGPPLPMPRAGSPVTDPASGLTIPHGMLTALVTAAPEEAAALADRLARLSPPDGAARVPPPRIGGIPVDRLDTDEVRRRIVVSEAEPRLFSGSLREQVDPTGGRSDAEILAAIDVADAADVLLALPDGLDAQVEERGRSFSGGQRQRLALARAVLAEPEVLVLVEPTSSVDAHTEARVADRLRAARAGRTTLVTTTSPLLLDRADRVAFVSGGRVLAEGTHRELLHTHSGYIETVTRGEDR